MAVETGRFQKADRLRRPVEFQRALRRGRRAPGSAFVVVASERVSTGAEIPVSRLGVTVSRKVGGAVVRNQVKRRIREWFRARRDSLGGGLDWVVIGRPAAAALGREAAEEELSRLARAASRRSVEDGAA